MVQHTVPLHNAAWLTCSSCLQDRLPDGRTLLRMLQEFYNITGLVRQLRNIAEVTLDIILHLLDQPEHRRSITVSSQLRVLDLRLFWPCFPPCSSTQEASTCS